MNWSDEQLSTFCTIIGQEIIKYVNTRALFGLTLLNRAMADYVRGHMVEIVRKLPCPANRDVVRGLIKFGRNDTIRGIIEGCPFVKLFGAWAYEFKNKEIYDLCMNADYYFIAPLYAQAIRARDEELQEKFYLQAWAHDTMEDYRRYLNCLFPGMETIRDPSWIDFRSRPYFSAIVEARNWKLMKKIGESKFITDLMTRAPFGRIDDMWTILDAKDECSDIYRGSAIKEAFLSGNRTFINFILDEIDNKRYEWPELARLCVDWSFYSNSYELITETYELCRDLFKGDEIARIFQRALMTHNKEVINYFRDLLPPNFKYTSKMLFTCPEISEEQLSLALEKKMHLMRDEWLYLGMSNNIELIKRTMADLDDELGLKKCVDQVLAGQIRVDGDYIEWLLQNYKFSWGPVLVGEVRWPARALCTMLRAGAPIDKIYSYCGYSPEDFWAIVYAQE